MTSIIYDRLNEHDDVIQAAYDKLDKVNHQVYKNPNQQKNTSINGFYPDIIITPKDSNTASFIIEVETSDSVSTASVDQWNNYSKLGGTFYILIPLTSKRLAESLCRQNNIKARFGTYQYTNGHYVINYE